MSSDPAASGIGMQADRFAIGERVRLGGFEVLSTTQPAFAQSLYTAMARGEQQLVCFANTNFIVQCQGLRERLAHPGVRIVNDGIGMDLAARWLHGRRFAGNLNGTDFIPYLSEHAARPLRFFLLGGQPGVAEAAARTLRERHGQIVVGTCDGYGGRQRAGDALPAMINDSGADVLLVAFGNPLQEQWMLDNCEKLRTPLVFGVGALLDFLSGNARRAPGWVRRHRVEWLYRLSREPRRLLKRYSWDLGVFFRTCYSRRRD